MCWSSGSHGKKQKPTATLGEPLPFWLGASKLRVVTVAGACGRGRFEADFARRERRAAIGRRLPPFVGAACVTGAGGWAERPSDVQFFAANQEAGSAAKKEADPRSRSETVAKGPLRLPPPLSEPKRERLGRRHRWTGAEV
jgi:hypothetical protein